MSRFTEIPGGSVLLHARGLYTEHDLYRSGDQVYAKKGAAFVKLFPYGSTSLPKTTWKDATSTTGMFVIEQGSMLYKTRRSPKAVAAE